jgi:hypothetical protein
MELDEVQALEECADPAAADACLDAQRAMGRRSCIETVLGGVQNAKPTGGRLGLGGFDLEGSAVVGACEKNGSRPKGSRASIQLIRPTPAQRHRSWPGVRGQG